MTKRDPNQDGRAGRKFGTITYNTQPCSFPGCVKMAHARGLCAGHWNQWRKGRELTALKPHTRVVKNTKRCTFCERTLPVEAFHTKHGKPIHHCAECVGIVGRMRSFGLTRAEVERLIATPCQVCGDMPASLKQLHIDHDHNTGKVRGVLCHPCNTSLGLMNEDADRLRSLADYIERHR